ncbi:hypothetical protein LMH87_007297 [Akanthomyces muscarius]|uniref:Uncharacterized protein n=1 Tax=Akanthomyces muscarius TaxID=2231603 RepID=A0A9W8QQ04_AKAMU|nr:hypothetical protein LMH87_007297 [Akanthomyces muscarius]KAJ4165674.1 hypothetical protein LMH87_007297 [Akanthomyces muscarius]
MRKMITMYAINHPANSLPNAADSTIDLPARTTSTLAVNRKIYQLPGPAFFTPHGDKIQSGRMTNGDLAGLDQARGCHLGGRSMVIICKEECRGWRRV